MKTPSFSRSTKAAFVRCKLDDRTRAWWFQSGRIWSLKRTISRVSKKAATSTGRKSDQKLTPQALAAMISPSAARRAKAMSTAMSTAMGTASATIQAKLKSKSWRAASRVSPLLSTWSIVCKTTSISRMKRISAKPSAKGQPCSLST